MFWASSFFVFIQLELSLINSIDMSYGVRGYKIKVGRKLLCFHPTQFFILVRKKLLTFIRGVEFIFR